MAIIYDRSVEDEVVALAERAAQGFSLAFKDQKAFEKRLRKGLEFCGCKSDIESKIALTRQVSMFSMELFQAMISGGESFNMAYIQTAWQRLVASGIVLNNIGAMQGIPLADHHINKKLLSWHLKSGTFLNLFLPPARLVDRYRHAVVAIDVIKDRNYRGTGFIVKYGRQLYIVTCRHNIDDSKNINSISIKFGTEMERSISPDQFTFHKNYDVAVASLTQNIGHPCFAISDSAEMFDEVYTIGYPLVPGTDSVLLGHRGEVNGRAYLYMEKCPVLIISNLISPGSSGSPVITRDGCCVGMAINWLEGEWGVAEKSEKMRFSAALPANILLEAVKEVHNNLMAANKT